MGGNGVFLSKYARNCSVSGNRFAFPGDSAVASVGVSNLADGTARPAQRPRVSAGPGHQNYQSRATLPPRQQHLRTGC